MEPDEQALNDQLNGREPEEVEAPEVEEVEAEVEAPEVEDDHDEPAPEPKLTRGEERFQKLANERAEAKARADQAERERDFYRTQAEQAQARQNPPPIEEELDPNVKWQRETNQELARHRFQTNDTLDQAKFTMELSKKPAYAPFADDVEKRLDQFRRAGGNPTRLQVLTVIAGEKALEKLEKAPALKREAAARVKAAQGTPLRTASNVATATKASQSTFERLKDMPI